MGGQTIKKTLSYQINSGTANASLATTSTLDLSELSKKLFSEGTDGSNEEVIILVNPKIRNALFYRGNISQGQQLLKTYQKKKSRIVRLNNKKYKEKSSAIKVAETIGTLAGSAAGAYQKARTG